MVRLWSWEAFAHGAEVVSYFRWRQAPFAQEQMHAGLNLPGSHEFSVGGQEASQVGAELKKLGAIPASNQAKVALVFDYEAQWVFEIQPQGQDFRYVELCFRWYEAARRLGLDIDIVKPGHSLKGYALVLVPSLPIVTDAAERSFSAAEGVVLYGPRTGSKTRHYSIPSNLPPGPLQILLGSRVVGVSSLRPGLFEKVTGAVAGTASRWIEAVETDANILGRFSSGAPALLSKGLQHYLACWPDSDLLENLMAFVSKLAGVKTTSLPEHVRLRRRGNLIFAFNYGPKAWSLPKGVTPLIGKSRLGPQDVAVWKV